MVRTLANLVSCNVHVCYPLTQTQARDVGALLTACPSYKIESVRGFDFFPQTQYVQSLTQPRRRGMCFAKHGLWIVDCTVLA